MNTKSNNLLLQSPQLAASKKIKKHSACSKRAEHGKTYVFSFLLILILMVLPLQLLMLFRCCCRLFHRLKRTIKLIGRHLSFLIPIVRKK